jgi:hypothetical protein
MDAILEEPAIDDLNAMFYNLHEFPLPPEVYWGVVLPRERVLALAAQNNMTIYHRHNGQNTDIDEAITFDYAIPRLAKRFGLNPATISLQTPVNPSYEPCIISFGTNYTFTRTLKFFDDLEDFSDFLGELGITEDPKWYVCLYRLWVAEDDPMAKWPL